MNAVELPALDGREPLGFLAAMGVLRLATGYGAPDAQLSFDAGRATAALHAPGLDSVDAVEELLLAALGSDGEAAVPDMPEDFPPPGLPNKPMRLSPAELGQLPGRWLSEVPEEIVYSWIRALMTDLVEETDGRDAITPLTAHSGRQTFRTMFTKASTNTRDRPSGIREALAGWRRVPGYTGEYLDHRVLMSSADAPTGEGQERGVPGATWLALMALPLFPVTARGDHGAAVGWRQTGGTMNMCWPLWSEPTDLDAASVLLTHPAVQPYVEEPPPQRNARALRRLGIFALVTARRRRIEGRKSGGVLVPGSVLPLPEETER